MPQHKRVPTPVWTLVLFAAIGLFLFVTTTAFFGTFRSYVPVTLTSDRAGLVMERGAKVRMRGIEVGRVSSISSGTSAVRLRLEIFPDQVSHIPANVTGEIRATTAFGAKFVNLVYPENPVSQRISAGAVLRSENVSTEVNTVFQNLVSVLHRIDPAKLNAVLSAFAEGVRGQDRSLGEAITDSDQVLKALNARSETIGKDWQALKGFSDSYGAAAGDIVNVLDALSTTSATVTANSDSLDSLLVAVSGLSRSGIDLLAPNRDNLVKAVNILAPTADLLMKYNPELTCMLLGGKLTADQFIPVTGGANGNSIILDVALLLGDDPYRYPDNLPKVGAKGGPGGKPSCGSLPDVANNWPVRNLVTDTGFGTGLDNRPNPGIGFPGYADYFPVTRANPESPSIRYPGGPAPGPVLYPGAPAYGQQQYAPDGAPLFPGLPTAPPPGAAAESGPPPPGSEPLVVPNPAGMQPTPTPPLPDAAVPSG